MKKKILFGIMCVLTLLLTTGCALSKDSLTGEEFTKISDEKGMITADVKEQFAGYDYVLEANVAVSQEGWQIEHYVLETKEDAKTMYSKNKSDFEKFSDSKNVSSVVEVGNYTKYTLETGEYYMVLSRVDNTLLYVKVPVNNKDSAVKLIDALGY